MTAAMAVPTLPAPAECQMCATAITPRESRMFVPAPGAAPVCPRCDRKQCGNCRRSLTDGTEQWCPGCGLPIKPLDAP
jgi:hypothetical protein